MQPIRIAIVEDEALFRHLLVSTLSQNEMLHIVGAYGDAEEALARIPQLEPDVVLLDIQLDGGTGRGSFGGTGHGTYRKTGHEGPGGRGRGASGGSVRAASGATVRAASGATGRAASDGIGHRAPAPGRGGAAGGRHGTIEGATPDGMRSGTHRTTRSATYDGGRRGIPSHAGPPMNGIELGFALRRHLPRLGLILLSNHCEPEFLHAIPKDDVGGWSYLLKPSIAHVDTLLRAIRASRDGLVTIDPRLLAVSRSDDNPLASLTPRQREVLELLAAGLTNGAIARRLLLSEKTIQNQINLIYDKLHIDRRNPDIQPRVQAALTYLEHR